MKKKQSDKSGQERRAGKKNNTIAYFIGGIVVLILFFFALGSLTNKQGPESFTYNNFEFEKNEKNGFWSVGVVVTRPEGRMLYNLETRYSPKDLEGIPVNRGVSDFFRDADGKEIEAVYLTVDPSANNNSALALAAYDLSANLARVFGVSVEAACTSNTSDACADRPIITCEDEYPVIYIRSAEEESVDYQAHRCIVVSGKDIGMVKSVDRLLFQWYGIMQ